MNGRAKGGFARAAVMTPEQRSAVARKAAQTRWSKPMLNPEVRINPETRIELMAEADGWVMVRRPGFKPFAMKAESYRQLRRLEPSEMGDDGDA
jgi:hypothetical protein